MAETGRAWAQIDLGALRRNIESVERFVSPASLMAVIKADAYGHGLIPVGREAELAGAAWLGVATIDEGRALREAGICARIAVLAPPAPSQIAESHNYGLTLLVGDEYVINALSSISSRFSKPICAHLDIDTGMGRSGVLPEHAMGMYRRAAANGVKLSGISTHLADADGEDETHTREQLTRFRAVLASFRAAGISFDWVHISNSAASICGAELDGTLVRPGLLIYGLRPPVPASRYRGSKNGDASSYPEITPVLSLYTRVATVRQLPRGHKIGYGATHTLRRDSLLATVLAGYADGYPRRMSNRGEMLVRGSRASVLGRVNMDQTVIDVTGIPGVVPGDIATIIGKDGNEMITAEEIAKEVGATEHEITTCIGPRIPRIYLNAVGSSD